jgi:hypothetical protein
MESIAKVQGKNLVIKIPVDVIKSATLGNPNYFEVKVKSKYKLAKEISNIILEYGDDETGIPTFFRLIDNIVDDLVESCYENIKVKFSPEDDY